jgi:hypothetical protein
VDVRWTSGKRSLATLAGRILSARLLGFGAKLRELTPIGRTERPGAGGDLVDQLLGDRGDRGHRGVRCGEPVDDGLGFVGGHGSHRAPIRRVRLPTARSKGPFGVK